MKTSVVACPAGIPAETFRIVMKFDLRRMCQRMAHETGKSMRAIRRLEVEWKKYVLLLLLNPGKKFPMSDPVDQFAHENIADTQNFRMFCRKIGRVIQHEPTVNEREKTALLPSYRKDTIPMMERLFGPASKRIWPRKRCVCTYFDDCEAVA